MKYGIVTVYHSQNCGSYLQAYALASAIKNFGHDAVIIKHSFNDHADSKSNVLKLLIKVLLKGNITSYILIRKRDNNFKYAISQLSVSDDNTDIDGYVLGSDTVWDVSRTYFRNHKELYWGSAFKTGRIISYAPSVGFAKKENFKGMEEFASKALSRMSSISVRDENSRDIIASFTDKPIETVCDPTLLLNFDEYKKLCGDEKLNYGKFIFLYYYKKMPQEQIDELLSIAKAEGLKVITLGLSNPWCDVSEAYDPFLFLKLYSEAEYVVTNTFHGTVFAHIFEKKFAVTRVDKPKITDLLKRYGMHDKMTDETKTISDVLHSSFDYDTMRELIEKDRTAGMKFLKDALEENNEEQPR